MASHPRIRFLILGIALLLLSSASVTPSLLADGRSALSPKAVMVIDNTLGAMRAQDYPTDGRVVHNLQGFRHAKAEWRIVSVKGWLRPSPTDDPGSELSYRIISATDSPIQTIEVQLPPGPIEPQQNYGIRIVYESNAYFDEIDGKGRAVFRLPRYPENLAYLLPKGHAVVVADFPMVMKEIDGRVQVMKENLTGEVTRDDRGNEMTVRTRRVVEKGDR